MPTFPPPDDIALALPAILWDVAVRLDGEGPPSMQLNGHVVTLTDQAIVAQADGEVVVRVRPVAAELTTEALIATGHLVGPDGEVNEDGRAQLVCRPSLCRPDLVHFLRPQQAPTVDDGPSIS